MQIAHRRRRSLVRTERAQQEDGYVLVKFALLLVPLLLMAGLSVDVGSWYSRIADIQKAADAAALAGVVWLPNEEEAETQARAAATRNGFTDGIDNISIDVERAGDRRLRVTISDSTVESFFWSNLGGQDIALERSALAEYVLPVPLGSPRNYFGTGELLPLATREFLYQAVNPTCTSKQQGDRHQTLHNSTTSVLGSCSRTPTNEEYRTRGYELYIEAQEDRASDIEVLLYDPQYTNANVNYQLPGPDNCVTNTVYTVTSYTPATTWTTTTLTPVAPIVLAGPAQYQMRTKTGTSTYSTWGSTQTVNWGSTPVTANSDLIRYRIGTGVTWTPGATSFTGWTTTSTTTNVTVTGPAFYQFRTGTTDNTYDNHYLAAGETTTRQRHQIRYRTAVLPTTTTCTPTFTNHTEYSIDNTLNGTGNEDEDFTFTLFEADDTPLDDSDNTVVPGCSKVYEPTTPFERTYLGSRRWNVLCTITTGMPDGRYILRVENEGTDYTDFVEGSNSWGAVARYTSSTGDGLCDGRTDAMCPRVYGRDAISVYAESANATAQFFLAEIEPEHTGKTLELELWDPGEGGESISILKPTGADSWSAVDVDWASYKDDGTKENSGSGLSIALRSGTSDRFNSRLLRIQIPLDDYDPPANNRWWKIQYVFHSDVHDRTTWSARVIGDPVHLLEEEAD